MRWNTIKLEDQEGEAFDLIDWLQTLPRETDTHENGVRARSGKHQSPMTIRLIARRKSLEAAAAAIQLLHQKASRKQHNTNGRTG